jgi:hypothetical protein
MSATSPLRRTPGFVSRRVGDDVIIVPVRGGVGDLEAIFTLNPVGSTIWGAIDGKTPLAALVAAVAREYEVTEDEASADVAEFVALLAVRGLVETAGAR